MYLFRFAIRILRSFASRPKPFSNCWFSDENGSWIVTKGLKKLAVLDVEARVCDAGPKKAVASMKSLGICKLPVAT